MFHANSNHYLSVWLIAFLTWGTANSAWALRSDREQPIDIRADRVEIKEKEQISYYTGNVHLRQGSLDIKADKITVFFKQGKLDKIVIVGDPATFKQKPEDNKAVVKSSAQHMEYYAGKEYLVLKTNARVVQGDNRFSGDFIEYDTLNSTVKASKEEGSESRVHAIIQPGKNSTDKTEKPEDSPPQ
ncbi:MAG: lipopolysaccharide transport periplasmic protein LptA [Thioalkalispiraceae bacterium]|jgi:lipopolysaccharide export system protein LptA